MKVFNVDNINYLIIPLNEIQKKISQVLQGHDKQILVDCLNEIDTIKSRLSAIQKDKPQLI